MTESPAQSGRRLVIGCMTGTSLDGLDVALVEIVGRGLTMHATLRDWRATAFDNDLRARLMDLAEGKARPPIDYLRLAREIGHCHARAIAALIDSHQTSSESTAPDFIVAHGQTIWHAPASAAQPPADQSLSWQLFDPWPLVREVQVPVCYDLRQADLIAGGEGAPVTPIADWIMFPQLRDGGAIINLGGVANAASLAPEVSDITGRDICPCNLVLDGLAQQLIDGARYDRDGACAREGQPNAAIMRVLKDQSGFGQTSARSLGRETLADDWKEAIINLAQTEGASKADILSAAVEIIAMRIAEWIKDAQATRAIVAGGGANHALLVERIAANANLDAKQLQRSDDLGIPCEAREAMAFAILGALSQDGVPITLPQITGATNPGVAGTWAGLT